MRHKEEKGKFYMENSLKRWKILAIAAVCALLAVSGLYASEIRKNRNEEIQEETTAEEVDEPIEESENWLSLWNEDATAKNELESYMKQITDENDPAYIPVENRIAVFDLDGTLFCETDPIYFDYQLFLHRVLEDDLRRRSHQKIKNKRLCIARPFLIFIRIQKIFKFLQRVIGCLFNVGHVFLHVGIAGQKFPA